jgi:putative (di)nucleoside polyphosphate hydrolase
MSPTFRAGVGMVVFDDRGRVLALERSAVPGAWQLPQGGIEGDEEPVDALWRELREETGLTPDHVQVLAELPEWLGYELPAAYRSAKTGRGQVHKWFLLRASAQDPPVRTGTMPDAEFRSWRWVGLAELAEQVVAFRRPVYRRLAELVDARGSRGDGSPGPLD